MAKRLYAKTWTNLKSSIKLKNALISTSHMALKWVYFNKVSSWDLVKERSATNMEAYSRHSNELSQSRTWKKTHWNRMLGHSRRTNILFSFKFDAERWGRQNTVLRFEQKIIQGVCWYLKYGLCSKKLVPKCKILTKWVRSLKTN